MSLWDDRIITVARTPVDLHGRPISRLRVTGSSLVKAADWIRFLEEWYPTIDRREPWVDFLFAAIITFHQGVLVMARAVRQRKAWTGAHTLEEAVTPAWDDAERRLAWFEKHSEELNQNSVPHWGRFAFCAVQGGLRTLVRLGREVKAISEKGHLLVNVAPLSTLEEERAELAEERDAVHLAR